MTDEQQLQRIHELTVKRKDGTITQPEQRELDKWLDAEPWRRDRMHQRLDPDRTWSAIVAFEKAERMKANALAKLLSGTTRERRTVDEQRLIRRNWKAAAVAVGILILGGFLIYYPKQRAAEARTAGIKAVSIPPGTNKAILELADGQQIDLTSVSRGTLSHQGNTRVIKNDNGKVSYLPSITNKGSDAVAYNTVSTPRGGTYEVELPDHSIAWLNAESSIRFPTAFTGQTREVTVSGEAYISVSQNKSQPFMVKVRNTTVEVLGTEFNINSYPEEPTVRTTLVSGAVKIRKEALSKILQPGQQGSIDDDVEVHNVDVEEATAWKNGFFQFNKIDLQTAMREIARWYDVSVVFSGPKSTSKMTARISRKKSAEDVLQILEAGGYHFVISPNGKTITVLP